MRLAYGLRALVTRLIRRRMTGSRPRYSWNAKLAIAGRCVVDRNEIKFEPRGVFPASAPMARWMTVCCMALNDLVYVNNLLLPRLGGNAPDWENVYLTRLVASHLYEAVNFLTDAEKRHSDALSQFLKRLPKDAIRDYEAVKAVGPGGADDFSKRLARLRNHFFHYAEMITADAQYEELSKAPNEHANKPSSICIGCGLGDFRAGFADDVAAALSFEGDTGLEDFVKRLTDATAAFLRFTRAALNQYLIDRRL
ncbi:MAG: hypothetical protein WAK93_05950 [Solirubrobacteraceae bacterium]